MARRSRVGWLVDEKQKRQEPGEDMGEKEWGGEKEETMGERELHPTNP